MTKPDYVWRNVFATIKPWLGHNEERVGQWMEFRIDLVDRGRYIHQTQLVSVIDLEEVPGSYAFFLDKMVEGLDKYLRQNGHYDAVPGINHAELLRKYIEHVGEAEGVTFLHNERHAYPGFPIFTDAEWAELQRIADKPYEGPRVTKKE